MAIVATRARIVSPSYQAYQILHIVFTVIPVIAGLDKFFHFLVNWDMYVWPRIPGMLGITVPSFMLGVGVIEVVAGLIVAVAPRIGGWVVAAWLCGIIVNLLMIPGYFDVAVRDLGLAFGAVALSRLSREFSEL
ncbi:MAG: hypothetical protein C5B57_04090 [Blastocatellia bacterium]|nr:MAG: hypothetical protein C5B57_04090 [Blastocatellia bacterium]